MQGKKPKTLKEIWIDIKDNLDTRLSYFKLLAVERASKLMADLITNLAVVFCMLMAFLALSITLAFYLSGLMNSYTKGFGVATLVFLIIAMVVLKTKDKYIEKWIAGIAIRRYFEKHCETAEEELCPNDATQSPCAGTNPSPPVPEEIN